MSMKIEELIAPTYAVHTVEGEAVIVAGKELREGLLAGLTKEQIATKYINAPCEWGKGERRHVAANKISYRGRLSLPLRPTSHVMLPDDEAVAGPTPRADAAPVEERPCTGCSTTLVSGGKSSEDGSATYCQACKDNTKAATSDGQAVWECFDCKANIPVDDPIFCSNCFAKNKASASVRAASSAAPRAVAPPIRILPAAATSTPVVTPATPAPTKQSRAAVLAKASSITEYRALLATLPDEDRPAARVVDEKEAAKWGLTAAKVATYANCNSVADLPSTRKA